MFIFRATIILRIHYSISAHFRHCETKISCDHGISEASNVLEFGAALPPDLLVLIKNVAYDKILIVYINIFLSQIFLYHRVRVTNPSTH